MAKKILLADDSITIQKVVELTFSDGDYEVVATNNGNKAIQKLAEMKPDIILSDIIMPEKNGYELCEYVKSHPDFRQIPVILLTGTFEPFDPDRAEKAGCDAVITKPFESQSLIHKVEELIQQSSGAGAAPAAPPAPEVRAAEETPMMGEMPQGETRAWPVPKLDLGWSSSSVTAASPAPEREPAPEKPTTQPVPITAMPSSAPTAPISRPEPPSREEEPEPTPAEAPAMGSSPFDGEGGFAAEKGAMPGMSFEDLPTAAAVPPPAEPEPEYGGATKALPKMAFEDLQRMRDEAAPLPPPEESDWAAPSEAAPTSEWAAPSEMSSMPTAEAPFGEDLLGERPAAPAESIFESTPAPEEKPAWPSAPPVSPPETPARAAETPSMGQGTELSEEQIERIARRVVELMSDQVIRNIAWEVIPDLAEMVVRERIRQLESEA